MQAIERIKEKLKDTTPGPWIVGKYGRGTTIATVCHVSEFSVGPEDERYDNHGACKYDAEYIAACNPAAMAEVIAHIDALTAENERLRKDAERYRFLKAQRIDGEPGIPVIAVPNGMRSGYYMNEENADYAVDTAMKGTR